MFAAARNGHTEIVSVLLNHGVEINRCTKRLESALMMASWNNHKDIVAMLLSAGADVYKQDKVLIGYTRR